MEVKTSVVSNEKKQFLREEKSSVVSNETKIIY
jgi:hypothetical protein